MTQPRSQPETRQAVPTRHLTITEDTTLEGHHQPMKTHLSAKQPAKPKSSTHLCITIRWGAPPTSYLTVTSGDGRLRTATYGRVAVRHGRVGGGPC
jgi:hypothetical protein